MSVTSALRTPRLGRHRPGPQASARQRACHFFWRTPATLDFAAVTIALPELARETFRLAREYRTARELETLVRERLGENVAVQVYSDRLVDWVANVFGPPET